MHHRNMRSKLLVSETATEPSVAMKYNRINAKLPSQPFPALEEQRTGMNPPLVKRNAS